MPEVRRYQVRRIRSEIQRQVVQRPGFRLALEALQHPREVSETQQLARLQPGSAMAMGLCFRLEQTREQRSQRVWIPA